MQNAIAVAAAALFLSLLYALAVQARARSRKGAAQSSGAATDAASVNEELVAIIAAAIAAATGMEPGSFRIAGISSAADSGHAPCFAGRPGRARRPGLNTPAWGHVDRFARGESE
jgi:hypothetical protein